MEKYNPLIYFISGAACMFFYLYISGNKPSKKEEEAKKKTWSKISKLDYTFDFNYTFQNVLTGQEIVYVMAETMKKQIEDKPGNLKDLKIAKGEYSISCLTSIKFIHRDDIPKS